MTDEQKAAGLSKWCSYKDATHSDKAAEEHLDNTPTDAQWANMLVLVETIYNFLCEHYHYRLPISSFFRAPAVNKAVGGSDKSAHMLGQAMDIDCDGLDFLTNRQLLEYIRANFVFDQLILEYPDEHGNPRWVHVAYRKNGVNRKQVLKARYEWTKVKGKPVRITKYDPI